MLEPREHTMLHMMLHSCGCMSHLMWSTAAVAIFPGGWAALALALDGDRAQAEGALDAIRYSLDPQSATSPEQIDNALVLLARLQGVLRCSALLCPPVGKQDQGDCVETGRQPLFQQHKICALLVVFPCPGTGLPGWYSC